MYTLALSDGTTTHDLNNSTNYQVMEGGVNLPPPPKKQIWGGDNPYRDGADLIESRYHNRTITIRLRIKGTSDDNLATAVRNLNDMLEDTKTFASVGRGAQVTLTYKLDAGSVSVIFDVLDGSLTLPDNWHNTPMLDKNSMVVGATLRLECLPYGRGAMQYLENYARNPDFELGDGGNPVHGWTAVNATLSRNADAYLGTYSMKVLSNCIAGQQGNAEQSVTWDVAYQGRTFTLSGYYKCPVANDREQRIAIADAVSGGVSAVLTKDGAWHSISLSYTLDAAATELTMRIYANYVAGADVNDYILFDQLMMENNVQLGYSSPTAWISGREVRNRNDPDNGDDSRQINYADIVGLGGDVPGMLKFYLQEVQNETRMIFGSRHGTEARNAMWWEQSGNADAAASNQDYLIVNFSLGAAGYVQGGTAIGINPAPSGLFRVFVRLNRTSAVLDKIGLGWTYGSLSYTPASGEYVTTVANYNWYDLGVVSLPLIDTVEVGHSASFSLNLWGHLTGVGNINSRADAVMLFPVRIGEGYVVADQASSTRIVLLNRMQKDRSVSLLTIPGHLFSGYPTALEGLPGPVDPVATRVHLLAPGIVALTNAYIVWAKVFPRYLLI